MKKYRFTWRILSMLLGTLLAAGCASRASSSDLPTGGEPAESQPISSRASSSDLPTGDEPAESQPISSSESSVLPEKDWRESWELTLINADNPMTADFVPELETVQGSYQMDARVAPHMIKMLEAAKSQGVDLLVISAYRSYERQASNFERHVQESIANGYSEAKAREIARKWITDPGTSEHQSGICADIVSPTYTTLDEGYAETDEAKWLLENAAEFGFILRYPKDKTEITTISFEPWHYRYVGVEHARKIMAAGLCLEEYLAEPDKKKGS